jgi:3-hydroxyacyl-CoA dehydrogenase
MPELLAQATIDGISVLAIPDVAGSQDAWRADILAALTQAGRDIATSAIVLTGLEKLGGAGGERYVAMAPALSALAAAIEAQPKPVVAAMDGAVRDAALELALACHGRVATARSTFGFTLAGIGLMPGAGATQRLPRLVGVAQALTAIALPGVLGAAAAREAGLLDAVSAKAEATGDLLAQAAALAKDLSRMAPQPMRDKPVVGEAEPVLEDFARANGRKLRGLDAPVAIMAAVRVAASLTFDEGIMREQALFSDLVAGPQYPALRHARVAAASASRVPELDQVAPRTIASVAVIGAGTMGTGIAIALLGAGWPVKLFERDPAALDRGAERIAQTLAGNVRAGRMTQARADAALAALDPVLDMAALGAVDLVIEAAYETMAVKQAIFSELDRIARPGAILATNTSYLDIDAIARVTSRAQDVVGLHFFSPANIMKLLEVVRGAATAPDVLASALAVARAMGKVAVISGNAYGFIGNRMLAVRRREAEAMAGEGASPGRVDAILEHFGFAMGPFRMGDLAGLDLGWTRENSTGSTIRERLCEAGRRGQKTGAGFYDYDATGRASISPQAEQIIAEFARDQRIVQRSFSDEEILDRLLWPMIDEGAQILAEGIARSAADIDAVWLNGYGWPAWTGGPMYHARAVGLAHVCRRLEAGGLQPSPALLDWAAAEPALTLPDTDPARH